MAKFRKKPVVIEAVQWNGGNFDDIYGFMCESKSPISDTPSGEIVIHTLEGNMFAQIDDWIIKGVNGEFYPCKPDIFEKTYEKVEDQE